MLFEQLNNAIARKDYIINNRNAYHYEVQIETKHKIDYDLGRWFRAKYEYRVHTELRFDHNRYNNDLQQADQEINNLQNQINNEIQSLESQLNSLVSQKNSDSSSLYYAQNQLNNVSYQLSSTNSTIQNLRNSISEYRNQYSELTRRHADLNSQIENKNRTNSSISNQIQNTSAQISSIGSEIELKIQAENQAKSQLQSIKQSSQNLSIQIQNLDREIRELVTSSNEQQRALLFSDCYLNPDLREISEAIELIGFDVDYLAYLGVKQNNSQLVRFAIEKDVDFTSTSIKEIGGQNSTSIRRTKQLRRYNKSNS